MITSAADETLLRSIWAIELDEARNYINERGTYLAWRAAVTLASFERYIEHPPMFINREPI